MDWWPSPNMDNLPKSSPWLTHYGFDLKLGALKSHGVSCFPIHVARCGYTMVYLFGHARNHIKLVVQLCMRICIYIYYVYIIYIHIIYVYIYICIYVYIYIYLYVYVCIYIYIIEPQYTHPYPYTIGSLFLSPCGDRASLAAGPRWHDGIPSAQTLVIWPPFNNQRRFSILDLYGV